MNLSYEAIRHNLDAYQKARNEYPILRQYEEGLVDYSALSSIGMANFGTFHSFVRKQKERGFDPISDPSIAIFANLKNLLIENTPSDRFKTFLKNRTKKKFDAMLLEPKGEEFDRLLNGAWKSRPRMLRSGRMSYGTRKSERVEGLEKCFVPLVNYMILNQIEFLNFISRHDRISSDLEWYTTKKLSFEGIRTKEIEMTSKLIKAFSELVEKEKIDFRKLNMNYVISGIQTKIRKAFSVADGTMLRCVEPEKDIYGKEVLTEGQMYKSLQSYESRGSLMVKVEQNDGRTQFYEFTKFEDVSTRRDDLLSMLLG